MNSRIRSLTAVGLTVIVVGAVALSKGYQSSAEADRSPAAVAVAVERGSPSLTEQYQAVLARDVPVVLGFLLEGQVCCEGARLTNEEMRNTLTQLITEAAGEWGFATLFIDINAVDRDDWSVAWELAREMGVPGFNGVALLTKERETFEVALGPYYFLHGLRQSLAKLAAL